MNDEQAKPTLGAKLWRAGYLICALICAVCIPSAIQDRKWQDAVLFAGVGAMFFYWWLTPRKKK